LVLNSAPPLEREASEPQGHSFGDLLQKVRKI
jgi:hypothetical protein